MHEGAFRILHTLADRRRRRRDVLAKDSGEALSVIREIVERYPKWFDEDHDGVLATGAGLSAVATELVARETKSEHPELRERFSKRAEGRAPLRPELDQVWATPESVLARARVLVESGEVQRGLVLLGDDDLTTVALDLVGASRAVTVLDIDDAILAFLGAHATEFEHAPETHPVDFRDKLPKALVGRFGAAFLDPPYAIEGFGLFLRRAIELTRPDARIYVCFGASRRAPERALEKQRLIVDAGLLIESVHADFHAYEGAESIGARSSLYVLQKTAGTRAESLPLVGEGPIYSRREPNAKGAARKRRGRRGRPDAKKSKGEEG